MFTMVANKETMMANGTSPIRREDGHLAFLSPSMIENWRRCRGFFKLLKARGCYLLRTIGCFWKGLRMIVFSSRPSTRLLILQVQSYLHVAWILL